MYETGEHFLSRAALTLDEDRNVASGYSLKPILNPAHLLRGAEDEFLGELWIALPQIAEVDMCNTLTQAHSSGSRWKLLLSAHSCTLNAIDRQHPKDLARTRLILIFQ